MSEPYPECVARFYDAVYAQCGTASTWSTREDGLGRRPRAEIGAGTGRLLREAVRRGVDAWGIDVSPAMVARCREQLPPAARERVSVADAVSMRLGRRFALVVAPFRVLSHVPSIEDQLRLLQTAHEHLVPGGTFIFDLYVPNLKLLLDGMAETCDFDGEWSPGRRLRRLVSSTPADLAMQSNHVKMTYVWDETDGEHRDTWEFDMRFFSGGDQHCGPGSVRQPSMTSQGPLPRTPGVHRRLPPRHLRDARLPASRRI
jgi:SAM-dependent methyltransferase